MAGNPRPTVRRAPQLIPKRTTNGTCTACPAGSASLRPGAVNSSINDCERNSTGGLVLHGVPSHYIKRDPGNGECQLNQLQAARIFQRRSCASAPRDSTGRLSTTHFECRACPPGKYKDFASNSAQCVDCPADRRIWERGFRARLRVFGRHDGGELCASP